MQDIIKGLNNGEQLLYLTKTLELNGELFQNNLERIKNLSERIELIKEENVNLQAEMDELKIQIKESKEK